MSGKIWASNCARPVKPSGKVFARTLCVGCWVVCVEQRAAIEDFWLQATPPCRASIGSIVVAAIATAAREKTKRLKNIILVV